MVVGPRLADRGLSPLLALCFDAQHERLDKDENWSAIINSEANATKGLTQSRMGALSAHSVQIDTARKLEGLASLALSATSAQASFQELDYLLSAQRSRFLRPLASGVTLGISVFPETAGPDAHAYIEVQLSQHPDPNVPPRTNYRIRYVFTPTPSAPTRVRELYTVPVAVTSGTWNTLVLPITQDAEFGFAPSDGDDNVLHDLFFGVEARNGATARVNFDALVVSEQIAPADRLALQASLLQAKFGAEPDIAQFQGIEISFIGEHLNEYSLAPVLPDYEALFLASGLLNGQGQISDPLATANYVSAQAVAAVHARGGVVSYNHVFGTNTLPSPATPTKEQVLSKLLANELYGADVMEVGYRQRGRSLSEHLCVWDQLPRGPFRHRHGRQRQPHGLRRRVPLARQHAGLVDLGALARARRPARGPRARPGVLRGYRFLRRGRRAHGVDRSAHGRHRADPGREHQRLPERVRPGSR